MIEGFCGIYTLTCDVCGEEANDDFFDFYDAVDYRRKSGWKSRKTKHGWEDVCPECQEVGGDATMIGPQDPNTGLMTRGR